MKDDGSQYIDMALQAGMLTAKQADQLREELLMFPGQNARQLLIKRHLITPDQLQQLETGEVQPSPGELELEPNPSTAATAPIAHGPLPSPDPTYAPPPPVRGVSATAPPVRTAPPVAPTNLAPSPADSGQRRSLISPTNPALGFPRAPQIPGLSGSDIVATPIPRAPALLHALEPNASLMDYLVMGREAGCSDLHLVVGRAPFLRYQGNLIFLEEQPLTEERSEALNFSMLSDTQKETLRQEQQLDFALDVPGVGRHRCNVFKQRIGWEGVYRIVPREVPTLEGLAMPPVLQKLTEYHQGLVLVTGPAGCGKTTTVAAMLNHINRARHEHIITVEDPVEYVIPPANCQVTQREVGQHTKSFANALRGALRQDPDVISIGELRDLETTSIAISAAETGHLVFATLHTNSALRTVARIMDVYPPSQRAQICTMVAESMRGVLSQQLIPRRDGNGLVCAMEVLIFTSGVAQLIKEGKTHQLVSAMQSGRRLGMRTMDDALLELVQQRVITGREAYNRAENKPAFEGVRNQD
ncbi:MAG: PilT/PilU family type 4a pilus ATPase [Candidatus Sumerlaeaceae bacterium]